MGWCLWDGLHVFAADKDWRSKDSTIYSRFPVISLAAFLRLDLRSILILKGDLLPPQLVCHKSLISIVSWETRL